jgi:hypothetical protein
VSKLVHSDTCPRPTTKAGLEGADGMDPDTMEDLWADFSDQIQHGEPRPPPAQPLSEPRPPAHFIRDSPFRIHTGGGGGGGGFGTDVSADAG